MSILTIHIIKMISTYEFFQKLKEKDYEFSRKELKILAKSVHHEKKYYKQKIQIIADEIINLEYANKYDIDFDDDSCRIIYYMQNWELCFEIYYKKNSVKIMEEVNYSDELDLEHNSDYSSCKSKIGSLSVNTFAHILDLFKTKGKYANVDNPDILTLFNNTKMIKSARTVL